MIVFTVGIGSLDSALTQAIAEKTQETIEQEVNIETSTRIQRLNEIIDQFVQPGGTYAIVTHGETKAPHILMLLSREITYRSHNRPHLIPVYGSWDRSKGKFDYQIGAVL